MSKKGHFQGPTPVIAVVLGSAPDRKGGITRSDRAAVAMAVKNLSGEVCAYSHQEDGLRYAMAAGASKGLFINDTSDIDFDIALVGSTGDLQAARLAEEKQCALLFDINEISSSSDEGEIEVVRDLGQGAKEVLSITGPAVLRVSEEAENSMYISRFRRQSVDGSHFLGAPGGAPAPAERAGSWEMAKPRAKTGDLGKKTSGSATSRADDIYGTADSVQQEHTSVIVADAATASKHLLRFLRHHGFITKDVTEPQDDVPTAQTRAPSGSTIPTEGVSRGPRPARAKRGPRPVAVSSRDPGPAAESG